MRSTSRFVRLTLVGLLAAGAGLLHAQDIKIANIVELSGAGTTSGTMSPIWPPRRNCAAMEPFR